MQSIPGIAVNAERVKVPTSCHMEAHIGEHHNVLEEREERVNYEKKNYMN